MGDVPFRKWGRAKQRVVNSGGEDFFHAPNTAYTFFATGFTSLDFVGVKPKKGIHRRIMEKG